MATQLISDHVKNTSVIQRMRTNVTKLQDRRQKLTVHVFRPSSGSVDRQDAEVHTITASSIQTKSTLFAHLFP